MSALLSSILSSPTVLAIIAAVIGALGWGWKQRRAGKQAERDRQARERQDARDIADQVDNDVGAIPPDKRREELKKW